MNERKILCRQVVADDAVEIRAKAVRKLLGGKRQFLRPHVVRRRIDEVAGKVGCLRHSRDVGGVNAVRRHQSDIRYIRLAVAVEAVGAERKCKRSETGVVRRVGKAISAGRQQSRQLAGPEQIAGFAGLVLQAEYDLRDLAVGRRQRKARPGLGGKAIGPGKLPGLGRKVGADRVPCRLGREHNRDGRSGRRGLENGRHAVLGLQ